MTSHNSNKKPVNNGTRVIKTPQQPNPIKYKNSIGSTHISTQPLPPQEPKSSGDQSGGKEDGK